MTTSNLLIAAILALDITIGIMLIRNYGEIKFLKGRAHGFKECSDLHKKAMDKFFAEIEAKQKDARSKSSQGGA